MSTQDDLILLVAKMAFPEMDIENVKVIRACPNEKAHNPAILFEDSIFEEVVNFHKWALFVSFGYGPKSNVLAVRSVNIYEVNQ